MSFKKVLTPTVRRHLLNLTLRWTMKGMWRRNPSIGAVRLAGGRTDQRFARKNRGPRESIAVRGVPCTWFGTSSNARDGMILYLHGGGFVSWLPNTYELLAQRMARRLNRPVLLVDYRLAPEHPFPSGLNDCDEVLQGLCDLGIPADRMILAGDSAGGNFVATLMMRSRDRGDPMPRGAVLVSPYLDFTGTGSSEGYNESHDVMFTRHSRDWVISQYCPGQLLARPELSPVFGDWSGLPPLRFHASSSEMLLDHSIRAVERARTAGVDATLRVWKDVPHAFSLFPQLQEEQAFLDDFEAFIDARWGITLRECSS